MVHERINEFYKKALACMVHERINEFYKKASACMVHEPITTFTRTLTCTVSLTHGRCVEGDHCRRF